MIMFAAELGAWTQLKDIYGRDFCYLSIVIDVMSLSDKVRVHNLTSFF